jgi:hypothetical protein
MLNPERAGHGMKMFSLRAIASNQKADIWSISKNSRGGA